MSRPCGVCTVDNFAHVPIGFEQICARSRQVCSPSPGLRQGSDDKVSHFVGHLRELVILEAANKISSGRRSILKRNRALVARYRGVKPTEFVQRVAETVA